jgi:hypothetical protein
MGTLPGQSKLLFQYLRKLTYERVLEKSDQAHSKYWGTKRILESTNYLR